MEINHYGINHNWGPSDSQSGVQAEKAHAAVSSPVAVVGGQAKMEKVAPEVWRLMRHSITIGGTDQPDAQVSMAVKLDPEHIQTGIENTKLLIEKFAYDDLRVKYGQQERHAVALVAENKKLRDENELLFAERNQFQQDMMDRHERYVGKCKLNEELRELKEKFECKSFDESREHDKTRYTLELTAAKNMKLSEENKQLRAEIDMRWAPTVRNLKAEVERIDNLRFTMAVEIERLKKLKGKH